MQSRHAKQTKSQFSVIPLLIQEVTLSRAIKGTNAQGKNLTELHTALKSNKVNYQALQQINYDLSMI